MSVPNTPMPVVFKNNKSINKAHAKDLPTIKSSTLMRNLPLETLVISRNGYCTAYRYVGKSPYDYAEWYQGHNSGHISMRGALENTDLLNAMVETVNILRPFVSKLFSK